MTENYTQAIVELLESGQSLDTVLANVKKVMERRGHSALYGATLKSVVKQLEVRAQQKQALVTVASAKDENSAVVKNTLAKLGADGASVTTIVDPTIIGGAIVSFNNAHIDQSYKTALKNLYQSITTN